MDSDHRPLERIFEKELNDISLRMQRMRLKLQKYDLKVKYRKGTEILLADALSRAYIPNEKEEKVCNIKNEQMAKLAIRKKRQI